MNTYLEQCVICEKEKECYRGVCEDCAHKRELNNQEARATGN